ncbi:hypothetical protein CERSUDRAFT_101090 [Gelatoporia subvermispora B]|uniref:F-box domain-containing protein n=1 Tax=Ceriporiopsis subvermispora (strain B) TaxID=914234 RepID=M2QF86_CERS8|nr:hypothetical protein CERSUDRAFT_101090 [Gelatoporia subvermispora B]
MLLGVLSQDAIALMPLPQDVLSEMVVWLEVPTLLSFRQCCSLADRVVSRELNIRRNRCLHPYIAFPDPFRALLRIAGAVVVGSSAALFFDPTAPYTSSDLDVSVPAGFGQRFQTYLQHCEGYTHHADVDPLDDYIGGLTRTIRMRKDNLQIDILESHTPLAAFPVPHFLGTHLFCWLSADSFCTAYPGLAFERRSLITENHIFFANAYSAA